ncbi:carboxymuconolactone decarboxylase family protein [Olivibacter sp. SDN3]|uniref:carboxymuconolactone decarboxylase family protein n=1 Tax=Olivibacter sp. SDN3 TaxID=2764720 RepID=UPI00165170C0|nr:carboxymuconolactone decarboxylase family protein [Olivibacter sp. SDN3]QNL52321.1 carboxymuconolactone decarboxylase family protein [Olivibacter sp. SDN3]
MERISQKEMPNGLYQAMRGVQSYIERSGLDPLLVKLVFMRVSQLNGCAYCLDMHSKDATAAGETLQRLVSLPAWRETNYYSGAERAALAFAERLTDVQDDRNPDDIHDELLNFFSKEEIANLTLAVAQINSWNRLVKSFGTIAGSYKISGNHPD